MLICGVSALGFCVSVVWFFHSAVVCAFSSLVLFHVTVSVIVATMAHADTLLLLLLQARPFARTAATTRPSPAVHSMTAP
jgi:hypothetical protein